ncbi:MAG: hypothetical protein ACSHWU_08380 [Marinicella sp.]
MSASSRSNNANPHRRNHNHLSAGQHLPLDDYDIDGDGDFMELLPLDLDGYARDVGFNVDMGPYEFGDLIFRDGFD